MKYIGIIMFYILLLANAIYPQHINKAIKFDSLENQEALRRRPFLFDKYELTEEFDIKKDNKIKRSSVYKPVQIIVNSDFEGTTKSTFIYDSSGNMSLKLVEKLVNSCWTFYSRDTCTYDSSGNLLSILSEIWSNNIWNNNNKVTYTYDLANHMITYLSESWSNGMWVNLDKDTYAYDENGHLYLAIWERWLNGMWAKAWRSTYTNDLNGNHLSFLIECWFNDCWNNYDLTTYTYDSNGNRLTRLQRIWTNGIWDNSDRSTYTYDDRGNLLTYFWEGWREGTWVNGIRNSYTYNNDGSRSTILQEGWSDGAWCNNERATFSYEKSYNIMREIWELWSDGVWHNYERFDYFDDGFGNTLKGEHYKWEHYAWTLMEGNLYLQYNNGKDTLQVTGSDAEVVYMFENLPVTLTSFCVSCNNDTPLLNWKTSTENNNYGFEIEKSADKSIWQKIGFVKGSGTTTVPKEYYFCDTISTPSKLFYYRLKQIDFNGSIRYSPVVDFIFKNNYNFSISQNYPNPFNSATTINYQMPKAGVVSVKVYDILGNEIKTLVNEYKQPGSYSVSFDASKLSSGVYIYKITAGDYEAGRKMLLVK
jgi:hypothetical protein